MTSQGFSLVELLITLGLIVVLAGLAVPGLSELKRQHDRNSAHSTVLQAFSTARHLARARAQWVEVTPKDHPPRLIVTTPTGTFERVFILPARLVVERTPGWRIGPHGEIHGSTTLTLTLKGDSWHILLDSSPPSLAFNP